MTGRRVSTSDSIAVSSPARARLIGLKKRREIRRWIPFRVSTLLRSDFINSSMNSSDSIDGIGVFVVFTFRKDLTPLRQRPRKLAVPPFPVYGYRAATSLFGPCPRAAGSETAIRYLARPALSGCEHPERC